VLLASFALSVHGLERVLVVPTHAHAFGKRLAPMDDRLRMCELAFAPLRNVEILDIERELPAPNFTLNTLRALSQRHPDAQLRLLIGADILPEAHTWHEFASIERLAPPIVVERQGYAAVDRDQPALPAISSSEIRRRVQAGESTHGWLSPAVQRYILARGLYRNA
jgi:nicotinate-nucleotide adenylyltransferase